MYPFVVRDARPFVWMLQHNLSMNIYLLEPVGEQVMMHLNIFFCIFHSGGFVIFFKLREEIIHPCESLGLLLVVWYAIITFIFEVVLFSFLVPK